jgi:hypothetical protein
MTLNLSASSRDSNSSRDCSTFDPLNEICGSFESIPSNILDRDTFEPDRRPDNEPDTPLFLDPICFDRMRFFSEDLKESSQRAFLKASISDIVMGIPISSNLDTSSDMDPSKDGETSVTSWKKCPLYLII